MFAELVLGVTYVHSHQVAHRDLHCGNLLVHVDRLAAYQFGWGSATSFEFGTLKILDFGSAKFYSEAEDEDSRGSGATVSDLVNYEQNHHGAVFEITEAGWRITPAAAVNTSPNSSSCPEGSVSSSTDFGGVHYGIRPEAAPSGNLSKGYKKDVYAAGLVLASLLSSKVVCTEGIYRMGNYLKLDCANGYITISEEIQEVVRVACHLEPSERPSIEELGVDAQNVEEWLVAAITN